MPQRVGWKGLGIGILSACAVIGGALLILIFGRVGSLHGKKFTLVVSTSAARGVIRGSEVWLDGQRVGAVKNVAFQPPSASRDERLVLTLEVLNSARDYVRRDSRISLRSGLSIIGEQVVYITSGTASQPGIRDGDTLRALAQNDNEGLTSDFALASKEFPGIIENVKLLGAQLQSAQSTLGALGLEQNGPDMGRLRARAARLLSQFTTSNGSIGLAVGSMGDMRARATRAMAQVDSVRALLASDKHSLGRLRRDSTLALEIGRLRAELANLQRLAAEPTGTIGRLRADSAIVRNVHRDLAALDSLIADVKKHPLRYIAF
jgi:ABC-type transporter Mla subunit MlaD